MTRTRSDLHTGSTISQLDGTPWRLVVHWHHVGKELVPAGIEVRCYGVKGDDPADFNGGQETPHHESPEYAHGELPRRVSSDLLVKRIKWGQVFAEHAATFASQLEQSAKETEGFHPPSADLMWSWARSARGQKRAGDDTYRLVAALHSEAQLVPDFRSRPSVYVLSQLRDVYGYELDPSSTSDRQKVRTWIGEARKRSYLAPSTKTTNRKEQE